MTGLVAGRKVVLVFAALGAAAIIAAAILWRVAAPERKAAIGRMYGDAARTNDMVRIRGGSLLMGSNSAEIEAAIAWCQLLTGAACDRASYEQEQPARSVEVPDFELDRTEVTNAAFAAWRKGRAPAGMELLPVVGIAPADATAFCAARGAALPSEAQWEYAARGTARRRFPWGDDEPRCADTVFARSPGMVCADAGSGPAAVGNSKQDVTPDGVADLGGNVSELVSEPGIVRGGSWEDHAVATRAAGRRIQARQVGFRCARRGR